MIRQYTTPITESSRIQIDTMPSCEIYPTLVSQVWESAQLLSTPPSRTIRNGVRHYLDILESHEDLYELCEIVVRVEY